MSEDVFNLNGQAVARDLAVVLAERDDLRARLARVETLAEEATERAFAQIATDKMLTIQPLPGGRAKVPPHWRDEAEALATVAVTDLRAALAPRPSAHAEQESE